MTKQIIKTIKEIGRFDNVAIVTHDKADGDALTSSWLMRSILAMRHHENVHNYVHSIKRGDYASNFDLDKIKPLKSVMPNGYGNDTHYKYVIMVDTNPTQDRVDILKDLSYDKLLIIDHHAHEGKNAIFTENICLSTSYLSCSELLWELAFELLSEEQIKILLNKNHYIESTLGVFTDNGNLTYNKNYVNTLRLLAKLEELSDINLTGKMMAMKNVKSLKTVEKNLEEMSETGLNYEENKAYMHIESNGWSSELKDIICNIKEVQKVLVTYKNATQESIDSKIYNYEDEPVGVFVRNNINDFDIRTWLDSEEIAPLCQKVAGQAGIAKVWFENHKNAEIVFNKFKKLDI